eukprot:333639-Prorocentrum_lima.AAC.1
MSRGCLTSGFIAPGSGSHTRRGCGSASAGSGRGAGTTLVFSLSLPAARWHPASNASLQEPHQYRSPSH